jgi:hypothetical protein
LSTIVGTRDPSYAVLQCAFRLSEQRNAPGFDKRRPAALQSAAK